MSLWENPTFLRWFCKPDAPLETKRLQFLYVVTTSTMIVCQLMALPAALRTHGKTYNPIFGLMVTLVGCLVHSRWTKAWHSYRVLCVALIYYNVHFLLIEGAFLSNRQVASAGAAATILAVYICPTGREPAVWFAIFLIANLAVMVAQLSGHIDPPMNNTVLHGAVHILSVQSIYFVFCWFVVHVYNKELKLRQTMQEELHLFARLSHEIRTPITVIVGMTELIHEEWPLTTEQRGTISDMATAARRLRSVVNDLIAFSGTDNNRPTADSQCGEEEVEFNVREVVDTVIGYHLHQAERSNVNIYTDIPSGLSIEVKGEKPRLVCILDHLVSNAVKFTHAGSVTVKVRAENETLVPGTDATFSFEVIDTGVGIAPEELVRLFQPFPQLRKLPTYEYEGLGLGLVVSQRMAQRWGHSIRAHSLGPAHGSTFSFRAPLKVLATTRQRVAPTTLNVLIMDDDNASGRGIAQTCESIGAHAERVTFDQSTVELGGSFDATILSPSLTAGVPIEAVQKRIALKMEELLSYTTTNVNIIAICAPLVLKDWSLRAYPTSRFVRQPPSLSELTRLFNATRKEPTLRKDAPVALRLLRQSSRASQSQSLSDLHDRRHNPQHTQNAISIAPSLTSAASSTNTPSSSAVLGSRGAAMPSNPLRSGVIMSFSSQGLSQYRRLPSWREHGSSALTSSGPSASPDPSNAAVALSGQDSTNHGSNRKIELTFYRSFSHSDLKGAKDFVLV